MLTFKPRDPEANRVSFYAAGAEVQIEQSGFQVDDSPRYDVSVDADGNEFEVELPSENAEVIAALRAHPEVVEVGAAAPPPPPPAPPEPVSDPDDDEV